MARPFILGAIGFCHKRGWISKTVRGFTRSKWDSVLIVTSADPGWVMALAGGRWTVRSVSVARFYSMRYVTAFFSPVGFTTEEVDGAIAAVCRNPAKGGILSSGLVLQYLRAIEPGGKWDAMDKNAVSPEGLFAEIAAHPKFKLVENA